MEGDEYLEFSKEGSRAIQAPSSAVVRFLRFFFVEMLDSSVRSFWSNYEEYFDVVKDFTTSSFTATKLMITTQGAIGRLLEFIMNNKPPFSGVKPTKPTMGRTGVYPSLKEPLDLLCYLIRCTVTQGIVQSERYPPSCVFSKETGQCHLPLDEIKPIVSQDCITELLRRTTESMNEDTIKSLSSIVEHLSWGDIGVSRLMLSYLFNYIKS